MVRILLWFAILLLLSRVIRAGLRASEAASYRAPRPPIPPPAGEPDPYEVLGVARGASPEDIRAAYQKKVRENHPDKVAGMSQEIRDLAQRRTQEINVAYDKLDKAGR
jgi:DnaJ-class molecular chaperone